MGCRTTYNMLPLKQESMHAHTHFSINIEELNQELIKIITYRMWVRHLGENYGRLIMNWTLHEIKKLLLFVRQ